jgi:hypothetical protein
LVADSVGASHSAEFEAMRWQKLDAIPNMGPALAIGKHKVSETMHFRAAADMSAACGVLPSAMR